MLFPTGWIQDERVLEEATQRVALLYQNYRGLPAREAEVLYMQEVEKMEGYGQESTPAKDSQGTDILLGWTASLSSAKTEGHPLYSSGMKLTT